MIRKNALKHLWRDRRGVIAVEMGLFASVLMLLMIPLMDLGLVYYRSSQLASSVRAGMQYATRFPTDTAGITARIQNASSLGAGVSVSNTQACECDGVSATCGTTCASGMQTFRVISATHSQALFISYPSLTNPYVLTRAITIRTN